MWIKITEPATDPRTIELGVTEVEKWVEVPEDLSTLYDVE